MGKAMAKSPDKRYQHADEMLVDLRALRAGASATRKAATGMTTTIARPTASAGGRRGFYGGLATAAAALVLGAAYWLGSSGAERQPLPATLQSVPVTSYPGIERTPAISPNGDQVAFSWNGPSQDNFDIYVQLIGAGRPLRLTSNPAEEARPVWSADGRYIAFLRLSSGKFDVTMVPALGGAERKLGEALSRPSRACPGLLTGNSWPSSLGRPVTKALAPELCTDSLCECGCVRSGLAVVVRW